MARKIYIYRPDHPDANERGFVEVVDGYVSERQALHSPFMVDRYMEGVVAQDGTDIGSRRKRREYMKMNGLADADDFKGTWERAAKDREKVFAGEHDHAARREALGRALYQLENARGRR